MNILRFKVITAPVVAEFALIYDVSSLAIEPVPRLPHVGITLQLKYVQLYMSDEGDIIFPDGFLPLAGASWTSDTPPEASVGGLQVCDVDEILEDGVTQLIGEQNDWSVSITKDRTWVALRRLAQLETRLRAVRFAKSCIAVLAGERLVELWLKIDNLSTVVTNDPEVTLT
jgi:hypothetical protein